MRSTIPVGLCVPLQNLSIFAYFRHCFAESSPRRAGTGASGAVGGLWLRRLGNWGSGEGSTLVLTQGVGEQ